VFWRLKHFQRIAGKGGVRSFRRIDGRYAQKSGKMLFGYCRVSSKDQNLSRQVSALNEYAAAHGLIIDRMFEEKESGKNFNREVYQGMKTAFRRGDVLIVKELDRLGRNMEQIKNEWDELQKMGVDIIIIDTEILNTAYRTDLEKTLISSLMFVLLSYIAEKEREKIRSRQAEGIVIAKKAGKYTGRKPLQRDNFKVVYEKWNAGEITAVKAMSVLNLSKTTFYKKVKDYRSNLIQINY